MMDTKLNSLPYAQFWDGSRLGVRLLLVPRGNPLDPLIDGAPPPAPSFATAKLVLDVHMIAGLDQMATTSSPFTGVTEHSPAPAGAEGLFGELQTSFSVDPSPPPGNPRPAGVAIRKYAPATYRDAVGFSGARTPFVVSDDSYHCALRAPRPDTYRKIPPPVATGLSWGKVIALALRQSALAEALGVVRTLSLEPPTPDFFAGGGWIYATLDPSSEAYGLVGSPGALKLYACRVPPLTDPRGLFTPVLFPVAASPPPGPYDDVFQEAADYDDGFVKVVHGAQPRRADPLNETDTGARPVKDVGIRLGWDDEQITIWLNRQIDPGEATRDTPMGVFGYRVDVREAGTASWSSLCHAKGTVSVGITKVGDFDGELAVEASPTQLDGEMTGTYWLPSYYTQWAGASLLGMDPLTFKLLGGAPPTGTAVSGVRPDVALRYGATYEFRIRLVDHTGGGPEIGEEPQSTSIQPVTSVAFRRFVRPGPPVLETTVAVPPDPTKRTLQLKLRRPRLTHPAYLFTGVANAEADLLADLPAAKAEQREVGLPDPDIETLQITVLARALGLDMAPGGGTDGGYHPVYQTTRVFPAAAGQPLSLDLEWVDVEQVDTLSPGPSSGPLKVPTARSVRLELTPVGRADPGLAYFGADDVRYGRSITVDLRANASDERHLFSPDTPQNHLKALFLQPEEASDPAVALAQRAAGRGLEAPQNAIGRIADALGLAASGLTLRARPGRRVVFGASAGLRYILAPDGSSITFGSKGDLARHWIVALRATIKRDWTWDGLAPAGVQISRDGAGIGEVAPRPTVNDDALRAPKRDVTDLIFLDAVDPKPAPGAFPHELDLRYALEPQLLAPPDQSDPPLELSVMLPMTPPPSQVPLLASAGIALSPYVRSADYSSTESRQRALWLEFDRPVDNPRDSFFMRVLNYAPDPVLCPDGLEVPEASEPPLPVDPEPLRAIVPGQSDDRAGADAMQPLTGSSSPKHYAVPLPAGLEADSPELFGFFTYEFRVGHEQGWSTAQGRYGRPLRVTGVQHPPPGLSCMVLRDDSGIIASAPFADPVSDGRSVRPLPPRTRLWVLLYAQVVQADQADHRNLLLGHKPARFQREPIDQRRSADTSYGLATWSSRELCDLLADVMLRCDAPLSCLAVEMLPGGEPAPDPIGANLGEERIIRSSPLVPVPEVC